MHRVGHFLLVVFIALGQLSGHAAAQDSIQVNATRLVVASTVTVATVVGVHLYQQRAWWQGPRAPFRFENDWAYALNIDKFGHVYGAYLLSRVFGSTMSWVGFAEHTSVFWGSVLGMGYELYVEVEDGFHKDYGFSPGDAFSDVAGGMWPVAQLSFPVLENFRPKWSYAPSSEYIDALKQGQGRVFIDDYQGQIYWLAMDPHFLMSEKLAGAVPLWLGISFGAAVRNLAQVGHAERLWYLCLDYNFSRIRTESGFLRALFGALDFFHFPSPGVGIEGNKLKVGVFY